jgi:Ni,Fe-hydrogenase maturation factor
VIKVDSEEHTQATLDTHAMDPAKVIGLVRALGGTPPPIFVVGCEPRTRMSPEDEEIVAQLSEPVRSALDQGVTLVESLLGELTSDNDTKEAPRR